MLKQFNYFKVSDVLRYRILNGGKAQSYGSIFRTGPQCADL
jgi:hypothetical protein